MIKPKKNAVMCVDFFLLETVNLEIQVNNNEVVIYLQGCNQVKDATWSSSLAEHIRHHDSLLMENTAKLLQRFENEFLTCESFGELIDVLGW